MRINSLEQMEEIVEKHSSLRWNGWTVEYIQQDENAMFKLNGAFMDDSWVVKRSFQNENGFWEIPDNILRKGNVQI